MSSSTSADNFPFFTEFDEDGRIIHEGNQKFKRYKPDEVEEACEQVRAETIASIEAETQRQLAAAAGQVVAHLQPVLPFAAQLAEQSRREAAELGLAMARKIAGAALEQFPKETIEACLQDAAALLPKRAELKLRVSPDLIEPLRAHIEPLQQDGFEFTLVADAAATPGAWSIDWEQGALSHSPEELAAQMEDLVNQHLSQPLNQQGDLFASVA